MGFSEILKLKKTTETNEEVTFVKKLIIGHDIFAIDLCIHLNEKEADSCKILSPEKITKDNLELLGPSQIRGSENIEFLTKMGIDKEIHKSIFYKDMSFHEFGKRTKPQPLLWGEEWFTKPYVKVSREELFPDFSEEKFEQIQDKLIELSPIKIEFNSDKEKTANYRVHCSNGLIIECETLYFGLTPNYFYELFEGKKYLTDNFVEFCESTQTPCALYIHMKLENKITDVKDTYFLPLSFTHDWGHFIGEIEDQEVGQIAKFVTFLVKEENTEEDISRKIRLLKKNFEKIFNTFSDKQCREYVVLKENTYCPKIDDSILKEEKDMPNELYFIGQNATFFPKLTQKESFEDSSKNTNLLMRAVLMHRLILA